MIGGLGWQELLIILVIIALIFGASRVADLGGALGKGIREFRQEAGSAEEEADEASAAAPRDAAPPASESNDKPGDAEQSG